ncbi:MAG: hypothetical protein PUC14_04225 [Bacteroidales bacterium]|nr:hypothetical protein [Bacteroidales bacterium]MDD5974919.1 hypothetical protein [Bacteroidales bacterium]MDY5193969.1 hypothetical protein [Candidatus Aphodosoma sp.]
MISKLHKIESLVVLKLLYFRVADRFNIIDKPNERSSHSSIVLRGGGIIFLFAVSLGFIYLCPLMALSCGLSLVAWHWIYLITVLLLLSICCIIFMKKYYTLHEAYS